jgi:GTP-binding protein
MAAESIQSAEFSGSAADYRKCPSPIIPEYAFIGRSNVGKSSLLNMLTNKKSLAKTSSTPGKTQLINHFYINGKTASPWYIVDLPGYGFAKAPKNEIKKWEKMIRDYLTHRENLMCVMVLIDIRHAAQRIDLEFMENLGMSGIPFVMVYTKADKLSAAAIAKNLADYETAMLERWESLPQRFVTSADSGAGREELIKFMAETNASFENPEA